MDRHHVLADLFSEAPAGGEAHNPRDEQPASFPATHDTDVVANHRRRLDQGVVLAGEVLPHPVGHRTGDLAALHISARQRGEHVITLTAQQFLLASQLRIVGVGVQPGGHVQRTQAHCEAMCLAAEDLVG
jgi:hypothetical protein